MVRDFVTKDTIPNMLERQRREKEAWKKLEELSNNPDIKLFFQEYAKYLESNTIVSKSRQILHKMAKRVYE